jgi:MSHA pilin protein MshD
VGGRQAGISFIELIMFIVIVGIGVAGILSVLNVTAQKSADPMTRKQMPNRSWKRSN